MGLRRRNKVQRFLGRLVIGFILGILVSSCRPMVRGTIVEKIHKPEETRTEYNVALKMVTTHKEPEKWIIILDGIRNDSTKSKIDIRVKKEVYDTLYVGQVLDSLQISQLRK